MRELYRADLERLGRDLSEIARLVHRAMMDAQAALEAADVHGAERVISEDARIDQLQESLDEQAVRILALQAPVATDLRTVVATLRMSSSLERMGDLARHVAQLTRLRYPEHVIPEQVRTVITAMCDAAVEVAEEVVLLLEPQDLAHGDRIDALNEDVNALHLSVFRAIAAPDWSATPATTTDVTLASRYLERFTDHGLSVAAKVRYLVTGEWATHRPDATGS
ncbi:phosphate signaling complex protein PhoU [Micrococcus luteus]|uniref:Phosphate-specific transport system accessory protein PhoU n=1 Tax=Micrococcus luteus TaxID=1270 RepID=A0AAX0VIJ2_MICLU|nr:phosphate signaling complex protein PhoU [Micrococcus luteus]MCV7681559.1 phosphate signaling complex protein PhoU [Micrococcus luteus]PKZ80847.1 phosphate transport system regulatory protein PhoU [Micrococcus luteus]